VLKIVDHHKHENAHPEAELHLDDGAGSACTLVYEMFTKAQVAIPCDLAVLLLGTVLVDTRAFDPVKHIFNERDVAAVEALEAVLLPPTDESAGGAGGADGAGGGEASLSSLSIRQQWFNQLIEARYDVSALSVRDLLKLDYKQAEIAHDTAQAGGGGSGAKIVKVGFAALFIPPGAMVERAEGAEQVVMHCGLCTHSALTLHSLYTHSAQQVLSDMQAFCKARGLHVLIGLTRCAIY
jgi:hypothetical protein